jgi:hypothetical protein
MGDHHCESLAVFHVGDPGNSHVAKGITRQDGSDVIDLSTPSEVKILRGYGVLEPTHPAFSSSLISLLRSY